MTHKQKIEAIRERAFFTGMENAEVAVTKAAATWRRELHRQGAERCAQCGTITPVITWVGRRYLCRPCASKI